MNQRSMLLGIFLLALSQSSTQAAAEEGGKFQLEVEGGPIWQSKNNVQIPNDQDGDRFDLTEIAGSGHV